MLSVITSCIYIDNGIKVKTESGCSLIDCVCVGVCVCINPVYTTHYI